ncbi:MAG: hypothetical protein ACE10C_07845 [Candidatus Binatia bacterium]
MRAAVISHTYVEPENRGKLEALVRAGVQLAAFVPSSWRESALHKEWTVAAGRSGFRLVGILSLGKKVSGTFFLTNYT